MISYTDLFTPVSWIFLDFITIIGFVMMVLYVVKKEERPIPMVLAMFAFLFYSGIFENIGHGFMKMHPYSPYRLLRIGNIALTVSMLESTLFFGAYYLVKQLKINKKLNWMKPFMVAVLATLPDYIIDPVMAADTYIFDGLAHAQWNWHWPDNLNQIYDGSFFDIPFYNFTGWYFLMLWFGLSLEIGKFIFKKSNYKKIVGYIFPWFLPITSMIFMMMPTSKIILFGNKAGATLREPEIVMLVIWSLIGIVMFIINRKTKRDFSIKTHWQLIVIPLMIEIAYSIVAFTRGLQIAYWPIAIFFTIHVLFAINLIIQSKLNKNKA